MSVLPERLKIIRDRRSLTQRQLAKILNISPSTIALYETGARKPDPNMLKNLADVLDCSVDWLLGRVDQEDTYKISNNMVAEQYAKYETRAAHRTDDPTKELPPEAQRSLEEFKEYIIKKYKK